MTCSRKQNSKRVQSLPSLVEGTPTKRLCVTERRQLLTTAPSATVKAIRRLRVAVYSRVSEDDSVESNLSLPNQESLAKKHAEANSWEVCAIYREEGKSAKTDLRPKFQQMIGDAIGGDHPFDLIIVHSTSRFARNQLDYRKYKHLLHQHNVALVSLTQTFANDTGGFIAETTTAVFDEYHSRRTSADVTRTMTEMAAAGYYPGGVLPLGYKAVAAPDNRRRKVIVIDELEASVVRMIFQWALYGDKHNAPMGTDAIRRRLNEGGYRTRVGSLFGKQTIHNILTNSIYAGSKIFNANPQRKEWEKAPAERVIIPVPAIISPDEFERLQSLLRLKDPRQGTAKVLSSPMLLSGLARCGKCGSAMIIATGTSARGPVHRYYRCNRMGRQGKIACDGKPIPEAQLDDMVLTEVEAHLLGSGRLANVLGRLKSEMSKEKEQSNLRLATLRQETAKARSVFNNPLNVASLTDDLQSDPVLIERIAEAQGNAMRLERALESHVSLIDVSADPTPDQIDQFSTVMAERLRSHDRRLAKGFLNIMLSEVLVADDQITITGSLTDLKRHIAKMDTDVTENQAMPAVHRYGRRWCARRDSNS